jgi:hypothetical protein
VRTFDNFLVCVVLGVLFAAGGVRAQQNPKANSGSDKPLPAEPAPAEKSSSASSPSDTVVKTKAEFSAYTDTDSVTVFTPAVQASIENPLSGWSANGSYLVDVVSAASVDIVSTASQHWTEVRHAGTLSGTYKPGTVGATVSGAVSSEPDYLSLSAGGTVNFELANKTANPSLSYAFTHDTAGRTGTPFSVFSQNLARHTITGSIELILDPSTLVSFSADAILENGDQTKPYRFLPLFAPNVAPLIPRGASIDEVNLRRLPGRVDEHLPGTRNRFAVSGRVAQRLTGSTLILTERLYADDWGLKATTTDLRFVVDLSRRVFLWTHLRGHFQSSVSFWKLAYVGNVSTTGPISVPKWRTGDREESALEAGTFGAGVRFDVGTETRPTGWSVVGQADLLTTLFNDTLFIQNREGFLGVLQLESEF